MLAFLPTQNPLIAANELDLEAKGVVYQAAKAAYLPVKQQDEANLATTQAALAAENAAQMDYGMKTMATMMAMMMYNSAVSMGNAQMIASALTAYNAAVAAEAASLAAYNTAVAAHTAAANAQLAYHNNTFSPIWNAWRLAKIDQLAALNVLTARMGRMYAGMP